MFTWIPSEEYITRSNKIITMTKSLFILTLMLHSCGSGYNNTEAQQDTLNHVKNEQPQTSVTSKKETVDSNFLSFWNEFTTIVKSKNQKTFKTISLDSLECEQENFHVNTFIKSYFSKVFDDTLLLRLSDKSKIDFINATMDSTYFSPLILQQLKRGKYVIKEVNVTKFDNDAGGPVIVILKFIETNTGYKFFGYDRVG